MDRQSQNKNSGNSCCYYVRVSMVTIGIIFQLYSIYANEISPILKYWYSDTDEWYAEDGIIEKRDKASVSILVTLIINCIASLLALVSIRKKVSKLVIISAILTLGVGVYWFDRYEDGGDIRDSVTYSILAGIIYSICCCIPVNGCCNKKKQFDANPETKQIAEV